MTQGFKPHPTLSNAIVDTSGNVRWRWTEGHGGFIPGVTMPTPENTGVPAGTALEDVTGDLNITAGAVFRRKRFTGKVTRRTTDAVQFYECLFTGGTHPADLAVQSCGLDTNDGGSGGPVLVSECSFIPTDPAVNMTGHIGSNTGFHRCYVAEGWTDGWNWQASTSDTTKDGSCHDVGSYVSPTVHQSDPTQGGGPSHSDGLQVANGRGHSAYGTHFAGVVGDPYSHGVVLSPYATGAIANCRFELCWFSGGAAQLSAWVAGDKAAKPDKSPYLPGLEVIDCRFDARGANNDLSGGVMRPQSILVTPAVYLAGTFRGNVQTYPCTPSSGTPYGASATPESPVPAYIYVASNG